MPISVLTSSIGVAPSTSQLPSARATMARSAAASVGRLPTNASSRSVTVTKPSTAPNSSSTIARCRCEALSASSSLKMPIESGTKSGSLIKLRSAIGEFFIATESRSAARTVPITLSSES